MSQYQQRAFAYTRRALYYEPWLTATAVITTIGISLPILKEIRDHTWGYTRKEFGYVDIDRGVQRLLKRNQSPGLTDYITKEIYTRDDAGNIIPKPGGAGGDDDGDDSDKKDDDSDDSKDE